MGVVNSPRPCIICGKQFYPNMSQSLFCCEDDNCRREYEDGLDECASLFDDPCEEDEEEE